MRHSSPRYVWMRFQSSCRISTLAMFLSVLNHLLTGRCAQASPQGRVPYSVTFNESGMNSSRRPGFRPAPKSRCSFLSPRVTLPPNSMEIGLVDFAQILFTRVRRCTPESWTPSDRSDDSDAPRYLGSQAVVNWI